MTKTAFPALELCIKELHVIAPSYWEVTARAREELRKMEELLFRVDQARRETASDPANVWCRNATTILDAAIVAFKE